MTEPIEIRVDFDRKLRDWDGFGVNYVEMSHSRDGQYEDYGSFSLIGKEDRQRVLDLVFGADGLRPALVKCFLNPYLLDEPPEAGSSDMDAYRFDEYAPRMLQFAREGIRRSAECGASLRFIATMYGPPAWATKQKAVRGRDLNPAMERPLATFMLGCVRCLREREGVPVEALSVHNEGEAGDRWPDSPEHDFNMHWPPEQVARFLTLLDEMKGKMGQDDLKPAPGETTGWGEFAPYAEAIAADPAAMEGIGLITSHSFGGTDSSGVDLLRARKPHLHAWTTSTSWLKSGGVGFCYNFTRQVYDVGVNGLIPWAIIQRKGYWPGGDPNPNPPLLVTERDGEWAVQVRGPYYYYKQLTRAGQPGTAVAAVEGDNDEVKALAFADNGSGHGNAVVLTNTMPDERTVRLRNAGVAGPFRVRRTGETERFHPVGEFGVEAGCLTYTAPPESVTTLFDRAD